MSTRLRSIPQNLILSAECTVSRWASRFATHIGFRMIPGFLKHWYVHLRAFFTCLTYFTLGGCDIVGPVVFSRANCHNALSQLSRYYSYDRVYSFLLGEGGVMSSNLLMELHEWCSMVSPRSSNSQLICIYGAYRGAYVSRP